MDPCNKMITAACMLLFLGTTVSAWANSLALTVEGNSLSLQAYKVPLSNILQEITAKTGVEIRVSTEENLDIPISANFAQVALEEGLKRIAPDFNTFILYGAKDDPKGNMRPQRIVFYSKNSGPPARRGAVASLSSRPQENTPVEALVVQADSPRDLSSFQANAPPDIHMLLTDDTQLEQDLLTEQKPPTLEDLEVHEVPSLSLELHEEQFLPLEIPEEPPSLTLE